uniref:SEC-C motif domain protein n=1 Tax=Solibacter usitatus (strain Ellin6076) TaxID=234267 RepID=Q02D22_SOLUE
MELQEIVLRMERWRGKFERKAVEAAVERREEITPELLWLLDETTNRAEELAPEGDWIGHLYAMCLLTQFRELRAYPLVLRFGRLPGKLLDELCGDFLTEDYEKVLASVSGGDISGIQSLIQDESVDVWVRSVALSSLLVLVAEGQRSREEIVDYFRRLFRGGLERKLSYVWTSLVNCSCDLYPGELLPDIERAYRDGLVDSSQVGMKDVERDLARGKDWVLARLVNGGRHRLIDEAAEHIEKWCPAEVPPASVKWSPATSPVRSTPKVERNDPCPCGSGKKYKKCCGA